MTRADIALSNVHALYALQFQLFDLLDQDLSDPVIRKTARDSMKKFQELLGMVDHRYMGGEDILASLQQLPAELEAKLKTTSVAVSKVKKPARKRAA